MNQHITEAAAQALNDAKVKMTVALGQPVAIVMACLPLDPTGNIAGAFAGATFTMTSGSVMPILQTLIQAAIQNELAVRQQPANTPRVLAS